MKEFFEQIKENLEEIKNNPGTTFGIVFLYFLVVGLFLGLYFISNIEAISRQNVPPALIDTVKSMELTFQESKIIPPVDLSKIKTANAELLLEGENIYKTNCASCHGDAGAGGGPAAVGMNPAPRNFTSKDGWKNGTKLSGIFTTLQEGIAGSSMIAYDFLKPQEKFAVSHYIRNNFIPEPEVDTDDDLKALDALYNLSAGTFIPAQIPINVAQQVKINEISNQLLKFNSALNKMKNSYNSKNFENYFLNTEAALMLLVKNKNWRNSPQEFQRLVANNLENNIFNPFILILSNRDLSNLHSILLSIIN